MSSGPVERLLCCVALLSFCSTVCLAQNAEAKAPPMIDVHVHRHGRKLSRPRTRDVRNRPTPVAETDGLFGQHHSERGLPYRAAKTRHPVQQRSAALRIDTGQGK